MNPTISAMACNAPVICVNMFVCTVTEWPAGRRKNGIGVAGITEYASQVHRGMKNTRMTSASRLRACSISASPHGVTPLSATSPVTRFASVSLPASSPYSESRRAVSYARWDTTRIEQPLSRRVAASVQNRGYGVLRDWLIAHDELPKKSLVAICPVTVRGREHGPGHGDADGPANLFGAGPGRAAGVDPPGDVVGKAAGGEPGVGGDDVVARAEHRADGAAAEARVRAEAAYRLQPADLENSGPEAGIVLERCACRGDLSGVGGLRRHGI